MNNTAAPRRCLASGSLRSRQASRKSGMGFTRYGSSNRPGGRSQARTVALFEGIDMRSSKERNQSLLADLIRGKNRGRNCTPEERADILSTFEELEQLEPVPENLLEDNEVAKRLIDGQWFLQYTSAETEEKPSEYRTGNINASGVEVDTSDSSITVQQNFDVERKTLENRVLTGWGSYYVEANFRRSESKGERAEIEFETLGVQIGPVKWSTKLLFKFINWRRTDGGAWLDTTFIDDKMRLARGNKGSIFVLTREEEI